MSDEVMQPASLRKLIGYDDLIKKTSELIKGSMLPPVILFHGRSGIGKKILLRKIAKRILCETRDACGVCASCKRVDFENHPDLFVADEETKILKLDHAKEIQEHLSLATGVNKNRVVLINDVERLNVQGVNRLLKTFEEPPEGTIILMTTGSLKAILDTLLSRSMKWFVKPPQLEDFKAIVRKQILQKGYNSLSDDQLVSLSRRSGFSPGKALSLVEQDQDGISFDIRPLLEEGTRISESLEHVTKALKVKLTPKQVIAEVEEQLNSFYRSKSAGGLSCVDFTKMVKRRRLLSDIRKATMTNETPFNVGMILEAVAAC